MKPSIVIIALSAVACVSAQGIPYHPAFESDNMDFMTGPLTRRDKAQDRAAVVHCFTEASGILIPSAHPLHKDDPKNVTVCAETAVNLKTRILELYHSVADTYEPPLEDDHISVGHDLVAGLQEDRLTFGDLIKLHESVHNVQACIKAAGDVASSPTGMEVLSVVDELVEATNMALWHTCSVSESL